MEEQPKSRQLAELVVLMASLNGEDVDHDGFGGLSPLQIGHGDFHLEGVRYLISAGVAAVDSLHGTSLESLHFSVMPEDEGSVGTAFLSAGLDGKCNLYNSADLKEMYMPDSDVGTDIEGKVNNDFEDHIDRLLTHYEGIADNVHSYVAQMREEDGNYLITFPDLLGCNTFGATPEEALDKARETMATHIAIVIEDDGLPAPDYQFGSAPDGVRDVRVTAYVGENSSE